MFIYNVTIKMTWTIHEAWVAWMQQTHIPEVMETGCFTESRLVRLLDIDESEGPTYAAQYHAATRADYDRYIEQHANRLRQDAYNKWGEQFVGFRSLMQVVN